MYDLIILDLKIRKIDGQTLHKTLREIDENISIVLLQQTNYHILDSYFRTAIGIT
jgi:DNA-binding response OmpR family regulator